MEGMIGEIRLFGGNFAPRSWAFCEGQLLAISQNSALFSILGTTYGGDGRTTFGLPDLRGRVAVHHGTGPGLSPRPLGQKSGEELHYLNLMNLPAHNHSASGVAKANTANASQGSPQNNFPATPQGRSSTGAVQISAYADAQNGKMANDSANINFLNNGGGQAVDNKQPYLGLNYIICLFGVYPSRS